MLTILIRTLLIYVCLIVTMRLMGKRQIGELEVTDLVTTFLLSEIASLPITDRNIPVTYAILPMIILLTLEVLSSYILLRVPKLKGLLAARYHDLFQNPSALLALLKGKMSTIWSCFTYPLAYATELIPNVSLQIIYNRFMFKPLVCLEYGISVLLALLLVCSLLGKSRKPISPFMLFTQLYLLGNTAMLLLTECSNKYTISIQPFFIIACLGLGVMGEYREDARIK